MALIVFLPWLESSKKLFEGHKSGRDDESQALPFIFGSDREPGAVLSDSEKRGVVSDSVRATGATHK